MNTSETSTASLRDEHRLIIEVIDALERLLAAADRDESWDFDELEHCVTFFRLFADACHHGKEEDLLFPELEARGIPREGGPIGVMLYEHQQGRIHVQAMAAALPGARAGQAEDKARLLDAGRAYIALLRQHIFKENNILFMMADRLIDQAGCARLCGDYARVCARGFEGRTRAELETLAATIAGRNAPGSQPR